MRRSSASKSSPPAPTMTISPSRTQRAGRAAASGATSSGKYRFIGFSSRLWSSISSPSRKTIVRNPSHFGSNCQPSPVGNPAAALDNIGAIGGSKGRFIALSWYLAGIRARVTGGIEVRAVSYDGWTRTLLDWKTLIERFLPSELVTQYDPSFGTSLFHQIRPMLY